MLKNYILFLSLIVAVMGCQSMAQNDQPLSYYVSPEGSDSDSGSFEKPFKTIAKAKAAIRLLSSDDRSRSITVYLRSGVHALDETVVFEVQDGGVGNYMVTYEAYQDEIPVISSGVKIENWSKLENFPANLPAAARGKVWVADMPKGIERFYTLFEGNKRLPRARKEGFEFKDIKYEAAKSMNVYKEEDRYLLRKFEYTGDVLKSWSNLEDIEVGFAPVPWAMNLLPLESVDEQKKEAWLTIEANAPMSAKKSHTKPWVENVIDYLDTPGHWVLNTQERKIYYWPENGQPSDQIVAPKLKEYFKVAGKTDYHGPTDIPVKNIEFKGITFMHGERDTWKKDHKGWGIQHDWDKFDQGNAMLRFRGAENCKVTACRFTNSGGSAMRLDLHCQNIQITDNLIDYVGHMGILLCGYGPGTKNVNKNNIISNNLIHHVGNLIRHGAAIFAWQSGSNTISNNVIHHVPRKGVGICGVRMPILDKPNVDFDEGSKTIRWDEINATISGEGSKWHQMLPYLHAKNNVIENNEVYRALEYLADGSVLNVSGAGEGNVVRNNYVHHIASHASGVLRTDDWQRGTTFENNIIYKANIAAFVHKGFNHIVNNMVIDCSTQESIRFASYPDEEADYGSEIKHNIFYESGDDIDYYRISYRASEGISKPEDCAADSNLFYCTQRPELSKAYIDSRANTGIEKNSIFGDPLFIDFETQNFKLEPGSPAYQIGFKTIDMSNIGLKPTYPAKYMALDVTEDDRKPNFHRHRSGVDKLYDFW